MTNDDVVERYIVRTIKKHHDEIGTKLDLAVRKSVPHGGHGTSAFARLLLEPVKADFAEAVDECVRTLFNLGRQDGDTCDRLKVACEKYLDRLHDDVKAVVDRMVKRYGRPGDRRVELNGFLAWGHGKVADGLDDLRHGMQNGHKMTKPTGDTYNTITSVGDGNSLQAAGANSTQTATVSTQNVELVQLLRQIEVELETLPLDPPQKTDAKSLVGTLLQSAGSTVLSGTAKVVGKELGGLLIEHGSPLGRRLLDLLGMSS